MKILKYMAVHGRARMAGVLAVLAGLAFSSSVRAQQVTVLKNVNLIDGTGAPGQHNRTVIIAGDRIRSISAGTVRIPSGAKVVGMQGRTIMPLMINTHGHLGLVNGTSQSVANQTDANFRHQLLRYQEYGVGAVLSMGTDGQKFADIREASRRGTLPGADVYTAGIGFGAKDGVPPASMGFTDVFRPASPDEARKEVDQQTPLKPDFIKIWVDDFWGQYPKMPPGIYQAIIYEAHKNGLRVAAHLYHLDDARALVAGGVDVIAHSIRDGEVDEALLTEMKNHHVAYIPTLSLDDFAFAYGDSPAWIGDPFFRAALDPGVLEMIISPEYKAKTRANKVTAQETAALPVAMRNLKKIYDAGILVALGTDSGATPVRVQGFAEHMELVLMVQAGLTPLQAISVATKNAAQLLRISDDYGTLEPRKMANFIVLEKDPSQDIRNTQTIRAVWKNGAKVSDGPLESAQTAALNSRDVFVQQFSSTLPFPFLQGINNPPMRLLRSDKVELAFGKPKLDPHFESERVPCSEQNTVRGSRDNQAMKVDVMESVGSDILLTRCAPDGGCLIAKTFDRSFEVRCRESPRQIF
jgi:imidazolonepropionase-like amidohydrolase